MAFPVLVVLTVYVIFFQTDSSPVPQHGPRLPQRPSSFNPIQTPPCGGTMTSETGNITSPKYPENYPEESDCTWRITVPEKNKISLKFHTFVLEEEDDCEYDYLEVRDGHQSNSTVLGTFCGATVPNALESTGNNMTLKFVSDDSGNQNGFFAEYTKVAIQDLPSEPPDNTTATSVLATNIPEEAEICGGDIRGDHGRFQSPNYPDSYRPFEKCTWNITVPEGEQIILQFHAFDVEYTTNCEDDFVRVRDGHDSDSAVLKKLCGGALPEIINSSMNKMAVDFETDGFVQSSGFSAFFLKVGSCPIPEGYSAWFSHGGNCYMYHHSKKFTWHTAKTFCHNKGAFLASVHSVEELNYFRSLFGSLQIEGNFWIGLSAQNPHQSLEWTDGTAFNFSNWDGESDVYDNRTYIGRCVSVNMTTGFWRKDYCNRMLHVMCKKKNDSDDPVFTTAAPSPSTFEGFCPDEWYTFGDKCYRIYGKLLSERKTWKEANIACIKQRSTLVTIHSKEEQDFLESNVISTFDNSWIGMNFSDDKQLLHWVDNSIVDFDNWDTSQPNFNDKEEMCVAMEGLGAGNWHDYGCERERFSYICQTARDSKQTKPGHDARFCAEPAGWTKVDYSCYKVFNESENHLNWSEANSFCSNLSGNLATIRDFTVAKILNRNLTGLNESFWIGMRNTGNGSYTWIGTPSLDYFSDWLDDGQPISLSDMENCVALNSEGKWIVRYCNESLPFICETNKGLPAVFAKDSDMVCPNTSDWKDFGGRLCYIFEWKHSLSWYEAKHRCSLEGGHLAIFHSLDDIDIPFFYMKGMKERLHIGLTREKSGNNFIWIDSSQVNYTNWDFQEPNNKEEKCGEMFADISLWNDLPCGEKRPGFICSTLKVPRSQNISQKKDDDSTDVDGDPFIAPFDQDAVCPGGPQTKWRYYGGSRCFFIEKRPKHKVVWYEANSSCAEKGGSLVTFTSDDEISVLRHNNQGLQEPVHIGLIDGNFSSNEGEERYNKEKQCAEMDTSDDDWRLSSGVPCNKEKGFICSAPIVSKGLDPIMITFIAVGVVLGTTTAVLLFFLVKYYKYKKVQSHWKFLNEVNFAQGRKLNPNIPLDEQADLLPPYDEKWEFPKNRLKFGRTLGQGAFGRVVKAKAIGIVEGESKTTVAVKILKDRADPKQQKALMTELKILIYIRHHANIVNLLGAVTRNPKRLMLIVEYCRHGNLREYLIRHRKRFVPPEDLSSEKKKKRKRGSLRDSSDSSSSSDTEINEPEEPAFIPSPMSTEEQEPSVKIQNRGLRRSSIIIPEKPGNYDSESSDSDTSEQLSTGENRRKRCIKTVDLITYAFQCAKGMEYLASRKVIHRDLAARNVLVADENIIKICDFGLAKDTYEYQNRDKKRTGLLPIKWMAIESIGDRMYSTKSDVWSFGVLLWEIFTLGANPYPGVQVDDEFYVKLKEGYRMEKPQYAPENIYKIMTDCWSLDPEDRPDFRKLFVMLGDLIELNTYQVYIDQNEPYVIENQLNLNDSNAKESDKDAHHANDVNSPNSSTVDGYNIAHPFKADSNRSVREQPIETVSVIHSAEHTGSCCSTNPCFLTEDGKELSTTRL